MLEHMTLDEMLDDMPPAERAALEHEAYLIAHPLAVDFATGDKPAAVRETSRKIAAEDVSD